MGSSCAPNKLIIDEHRKKLKGSVFESRNCGAFPETILESELFGHEKGAFTGAVTKKEGIFRTADILFLDEIGLMSLKCQGALLRVIQEKKIVKVGGAKEEDVKVKQLICATNRDMEHEVEQGRFLPDLNSKEWQEGRGCQKLIHLSTPMVFR